jgi:uncharacterized protein YqgV (UPF0045/DUF77 family)
MRVQAEVSLYPLGQKNLAKPVNRFCELLQKGGIEVRRGPMSSLITGESDVIFRSLKEAFEQLAEEYEVVLTAKISNACPESVEE